MSDISVIKKYICWVEELADNIDFIDYWYNFYLSDTKRKLDEGKNEDNILSFWCNRWREDFEEYVDQYSPIEGEGYSAGRMFFVYYTDYLITGLHTTSKQIAEHYGKEAFQWIMENEPVLHTIGSNLFLEYFVEQFGLPPNATTVHPISI